MPEFNFQPTPVPLNPLMSAQDLTAQQQKLQSNALAIQGQQLANQYTQAVQPAQINLLLQGLQGMTAPAPQQDNAPAQPSGWQPPQNGQSILQGETPVSADPQTQQLVGKIAAASNVNPDWAMRVHYAESGASPQPFGEGSTSPAGAIGPMQLMPDTAKGLGVDPNDLQDNIKGGVTYLGQLKAKYGNPVLATAAYNAGPGRVDDFLAGKGSLPGETLNYVGKVFGGDGVQLIQSAMNGDHGPVNGVPPEDHGPMQATAVNASGGDVDPNSPEGTASRGDVLRLLARERYFMALPNGTGARAAAQTRASLDAIAGPGGVPDEATGRILRVPGSFATRYAASQATAAGETGPKADLYGRNEQLRVAGEAGLTQERAALEQETHRQNTAADLAAAGKKPMVVGDHDTLVTPDAVGVTGAAGAPASQGSSQGTYRTAGSATTEAAAKEGARSVEIQQPIMDQARESQNALNRIGQVRAAMQQASGAGLGPSKFAPELAQAAAGAKSLGIDLSSLGIKPEAIQNEQVAREALTQINGEILKRMFPQRITNADVATFGANLANYGMDPAALEPILTQAEKAAQYDVGKAHDMLNYKAKNGNLLGWETGFYQKPAEQGGGFGPDLFDAVKSGTVPAKGGSAAPADAIPPAAAAQLKQGVVHTFGNGQAWTLGPNGQPQRVK